jgi:hypothetical protein
MAQRNNRIYNANKKISLETKINLYNMIKNNGFTIKFAAELLNINYNSARYISTIYYSQI